MFDFGNANSEQREAIAASDGPVLITAGPGTGKTYTLVQRTLYLIEECNVSPKNILIATFTEKAAKELITRISNELSQRNIVANINDIYVGTFHSICLRILKENLEYTRLKKNYRMMDAFDQQYTVFQNLYRFKAISGFELLFPDGAQWNIAGKICSYVSQLSEELITPDELIGDTDVEVRVLSRIFEEYKKMISEDDLLDFSSIMADVYRMLTEHEEVLNGIREKITHIMVDEYQDTNTIQEQLVFLIAGDKENICVVGDDDQGLYRFRGATIRNILEFPEKFKPGKCRKISLVVNYRSDSGIINFYNKWMSTTSGARFKFDWDKFRYQKTIRPYASSSLASPTTVRLSAFGNVEGWHEKILNFIKLLKESGKLTDYNQIAFLFRSVTNEKAVGLARFLEANGINIYAPRSNMFFERDEVRLTLGCLMLMFPRYVIKLEKGEFEFLQDRHTQYFMGCVKLVNSLMTQDENSGLRKMIFNTGKDHIELTRTTDYAYSGLLYQLFGFRPFADILNTDIAAGVVDVRPARNLAKLTQIIGKFEYLYGIDTLAAKSIDSNTEKLFNLYLRLLYDGGMNEYEDDSEYAPSGCISFMTIHQAKGMEFPIVFVDSMSSVPRTQTDVLMSKIEGRHFKRPAFEPSDQTKFFDFWRLYYTAFSRAQDLLILTCNETSKTPSLYFKGIYDSLPSAESRNFDIGEFNFKTVKDVNIKKKYSFTSHITVYETCGLQYKFYKELEFMPVRESAVLFGTLVHETIEDIHKAAIRNEAHTITESNIESWFEANYASLSKANHSYLSATQLRTALKHVMGYVEHQRGDWSAIKQAEVDVSIVKPEYIIEGKIDLIKGAGNSVEIVDFKSTRKPDVNDPAARERLEHYRRQLHIYAHLVEERTKQKVSKMNLYYTGETDSVPTISYPYSPTAIAGTIAAFDDTVKRIMKKDFHKGAADAKTCSNCDFRHYCKIR